MDCPICGAPMEEFALANTKIVYEDNGEDTKLRAERKIYLCPECRKLIGTLER